LGRSVALVTQGCRLRSNPGLELANAFGVVIPNQTASALSLRLQPWDNNINTFIKPCTVLVIGKRFQRFCSHF